MLIPTTTIRNDGYQVQPYSVTEFYIGLCLAISSSVFIGSSFIIKKKALIRLSRSGNLRAGSGGFGYLKEWIWWAGLIFLGVGEIANFAAYAFAPASLVTPLGALSVLVAAALSSKYLNEKLNLLGKLSCVLCILGSTVIVIHSPKEEEVDSLAVLIEKLDNAFILYVLVVIIISFSISFYYGPKYGNQNILVYIILCSAVGSLTVMACKGLGLALKETISGKSNDLGNWFTYAFFVTVVICVFIQMNYLNKSLDLFNTSIVTPIYYVFFTTFVIIASTILFKEWNHLESEDILGNFCGFLVVVIAIIMLNTFRDVDVSLKDVKIILRPKNEALLRWDERSDYGSHLLRHT